MILVVDYGMGNLRSVEKALAHLRADVRVSSDASLVRSASKIVLPGVGSFDHAVRELRSRGLFDAVAGAIREGKPYVGFCLGLQLLFEGSEEGAESGFGVLPGTIRRFSHGLKVPHMDWNRVRFTAPGCPYLRGIPAESFFYFVHSYYAAPECPGAAGLTDYGSSFASVIWQGNVFATQFHPEKSQENGLRLLKNVVKAA